MKPDTEGKIPPDVMTLLATHLGNLEAALLKADPLMPNHLRESHRLLITYPETTHLLDDEEVARLIVAAEEHTKTKIISEVAKSKTSKKTKIDIANDL